MVFPLIIQQRQNIAKQNNIAPELQRCQADLQAAIANKADQVEGIVLLSSYPHLQSGGQSWSHHVTLLLDRMSINLSGAREKEGHFHYKNFLRASKWGVTCHACSIIPKSLYWGLGLIPILSKGILGWWSMYGMWYLISKLSKSFYNESYLLFLVHHWGRLTSQLRVVPEYIK